MKYSKMSDGTKYQINPPDFTRRMKSLRTGIFLRNTFKPLMKVALLLLLAVATTAIVAHEVFSFVINDTQYYMDLTYSRIRKGTVVNLPAIRLAPYSYTNFTLVSPMIGDDEIHYDFGYTPETNWCSDYTSPRQLTASYDYTFGVNSCSGTSVSCSDGLLSCFFPFLSFSHSLIRSCDGIGVQPVFHFLGYFSSNL